MQRAYEVGLIDGPQREHAPLVIPGTKKGLSVAADTLLGKSAQSHPESDWWRPRGLSLPLSQPNPATSAASPSRRLHCDSAAVSCSSQPHSPDSALPWGREQLTTQVRGPPGSDMLPSDPPSSPLNLHPKRVFNKAPHFGLKLPPKAGSLLLPRGCSCMLNA